MKQFILMLLVTMAFGTANAQKTQSVTIMTSAECGSCKERIESKLNYTKGVVFADLNVETKKLELRFKSKKITLDEIKKIISELGYDADEVKAVPEKQKALPMCCQPGGMKK